MFETNANIQAKGSTVYFKNYSCGEEEKSLLQQILHNPSAEKLHHFHVHVIPRKSGDLANNDEIYKYIEQSDFSFMKFYRTKLKMKDAITEAAESKIKDDASRLRSACLSVLNTEKKMIAL